ncbi:hypothetical protein LVJ94_35550 [Pendulispora rubella]|uniref:Lipoprotein n=1 Tax=Pendulispora rubella TaxID=2741070 RepID=A0ABZ2KY47_9BACT
MKYYNFTVTSFLAAVTLLACSEPSGTTEPASSRDALNAADWCARVAAGPPSADDPRIALSTAHANVRYFGVHPTFNEVDQALAASLGGPGPYPSERTLSTYAAQLGGAACALTADAKPLGKARVHSLGPVAIVRPGTGRVSLPPSTRAVLVDLRGLPAADGLRSALESAVAPALASPVARATSHVREHFGMTDEVRENVYENTIQPVA